MPDQDFWCGDSLRIYHVRLLVEISGSETRVFGVYEWEKMTFDRIGKIVERTD